MESTVVKSLKKTFSNTYLLYLKTQNYHWNVTGVHFRELHLLFEKFYEDLAEASDMLAERIRILGEKAPGTFKAFEEYKIIEDGREETSWEVMVKELHDDQFEIVKLLNQTCKLAQEAEDEATADMMVERLRVHQENAWMLRSILE